MIEVVRVCLASDNRTFTAPPFGPSGAFGLRTLFVDAAFALRSGEAGC